MNESINADISGEWMNQLMQTLAEKLMNQVMIE